MIVKFLYENLYCWYTYTLASSCWGVSVGQHNICFLSKNKKKKPPIILYLKISFCRTEGWYPILEFTILTCNGLIAMCFKLRKIFCCCCWLNMLTLILLNSLISHTHFWLSANQITSYNVFIQIHKLNDKQCRSWSDGFFRSHLIWIYTVCKGRGSREQQDKG